MASALRITRLAVHTCRVCQVRTVRRRRRGRTKSGTRMGSIAQSDIAIRRHKLFRLNLIVWRLAASEKSIARNLARILFHVELPKGTPKLRMPHPFMVIANENTIIGENCTFYHNVTIGSRQFGTVAGAPVIGDEVIIYPGACIIGKISVGARAIIGAGSIVLDDVPPNTVVAGNPARVVGETY